MNNYFYKIRDMEDDEYNFYISTDEMCGEIIESAIDEWHEDNEEYRSDGNVEDYIIRALNSAGIGYSFIDFIEYVY